MIPPFSERAAPVTAVIVTGAARGIGAATAQLLRRDEATVMRADVASSRAPSGPPVRPADSALAAGVAAGLDVDE